MWGTFPEVISFLLRASAADEVVAEAHNGFGHLPAWLGYDGRALFQTSPERGLPARFSALRLAFNVAFRKKPSLYSVRART